MKKSILSVLAVLALLLGASKSAQAVYDGVPSTGSYTVVDTAKLAQAKATGSLVVLSTTLADRARITVGSSILIEGRDWSVGSSSYTAAISLKNAINADSNTGASAAYVAADNSLLLTALDYGTLYNSIALKTSAPTGVSTSAATLTGGVDNLTLTINAVPLTQGRDWFVQDVASNTAINIAAGINNHPVLRNQVEAVALGAQIYLRANSSPVAYTLATSLAGGISVSQAAMSGGSEGNLARSRCELGRVNSLPTSNYPAGCHLTLSTDGKDYLSTETVTGASSWLASTLVSGAIDTGKLATDSVSNDKVLNGAIDTEKIAEDAVTTGKVIDGAIDTNKIGSDAVTSEKILSGAVDTEKLGTASVTTAKIADAAVTYEKIAGYSVNGEKIASGSIDTTKILNSGVSGTGTLLCYTNDGKIGKVTAVVDIGVTGTCAPF